ncbi:endonuclease/exonuclease/phosphatase family protein [Pasteurellaceae bacterium UScroc12]|nr:endonuclease/exonuclease/phosphatase family protein [Pasteurellaceae bacterium USgator41]TNG91756.1 endonuclease/exonuclease/phosphatase family protein [Pasteurellaceae bacterium UScroc12]TNG95493.1 endonuclease/exonuclease/phosphatase family protein [Pasteurellaceae bacterium UScroc31]
MKKSRFFLLVFVIIIGLGYHFLRPLTIFSQPKITTINLDTDNYQQTALSNNTVCFRQHATTKENLAEKARYQLLVWNLHKGEDPGWQEAIQRYSAQADFLLLQEATEQNQIPHFLSAPASWHGVQAGTFAYYGDMSGVMLLSHQLPQQYCVGSENEPWIRIPKIAQAAVYPLSGERTLLVINLHLVNFEWNPENYHNQLREMFHLISQHQGPIILAGDFNSWSSKRLDLIQTLAKQYALNEVRFQPDLRLTFMDNPLDHVFVRDIKVLKAWTEASDSSDHNPLLVEFELNTIGDNK